MANHALEPSFTCYVRLGGVRATLMALRAFAALTGRSGSQARPARAHSAGLSFAGFPSHANAAQRGVLQISAAFSACQLFRANPEGRAGVIIPEC